MARCSIEPRTKNILKNMDFYHLLEVYIKNIENNY